MKEPCETKIWESMSPREQYVLPEHLNLPLWIRILYVFSIIGIVLYLNDWKKYKHKIRQLKKEMI